MVEYDNERKQIVNQVPEEWKENMRKGLCPVCAKTKEHFHKRMRVYCSLECKEKYYSKIFTWGELRDKILERDQKTCAKCGRNEKKWMEERDKEIERKSLEIGFQFKDEIELKRRELLEHVEELYAEAMDDNYVARRIGRGKIGWDGGIEHLNLQVDHIVAIENGGDMWDEKNLQTLCGSCHKDKTKQDLAVRE